MSRNKTRVTFSINGQPFTTIDDDQEAASVLRMAGHDPADFDLARIDADGDEDFFSDSDIVRIHPGDRFRTRPTLNFAIDGVTFTTRDDDHEVAALLRLAGVDPANHYLVRVGERVHLNPDKLVKIHRDDAFVTVKHASPVA